MKQMFRKLRKLWYKLITLKSSPRKIAAGFALGIFLSYTPTFGFQTVLTLACATALRTNPLSALVGVYLTNVFTVGPIYMACYKLGSHILGVNALGNTALFHSWTTFMRAGIGVVFTEFVGGLALGAVTAAPAYFIVLYVVIGYRRARLELRIKAMKARIGNEESRAGRAEL